MRELELRYSPEHHASTVRESVNIKMKELLQPFKDGEDIALLVNSEWTYKKSGFPTQSWPQNLLTLLPCKAADVTARLSREVAEAVPFVNRGTPAVF